MNDRFDIDGMQLAEVIINGSGSKVVGMSRKGRPWTPIPIWALKRLPGEGRNSASRNYGSQTAGIKPMKGIWQKYKVWLLVWFFYTAYGLIKSIQVLRSIEVRSERSDNCHLI